MKPLEIGEQEQRNFIISTLKQADSILWSRFAGDMKDLRPDVPAMSDNVVIGSVLVQKPLFDPLLKPDLYHKFQEISDHIDERHEQSQVCWYEPNTEAVVFSPSFFMSPIDMQKRNIYNQAGRTISSKRRLRYSEDYSEEERHKISQLLDYCYEQQTVDIEETFL
ncbi:hypothetical protein HY469_05980 [Candidatus Roizmanbacteria bacterium]|nr:hypothetical protein [Candidatus Roizmanbacteria bacterium]